MELINNLNLEGLEELSTDEILEISAGCSSGGGIIPPPIIWPPNKPPWCPW